MSTPELYKDKIEVSLDGRQIFYLFFGGAVIVGLVFVLGVMVGRRVEARGHIDQARTTTSTDPLAALDRLEGSGRSFQGALTGTKAPSDVERAIADRERARLAKPDVPAVVKPDPKPDKKPELKNLELKPELKKPEPKPELKKPEPKPPERAAQLDKKPEKKLKPDSELVKQEPVLSPEPKVTPEPKVKFTLQLSSFQDKHEAESFLSSVKAAGYSAYVTEAEVSGKTFYRVRLGTYRSLDAANDAKTEIETTLKKTASVMRL